MTLVGELRTCFCEAVRQLTAWTQRVLRHCCLPLARRWASASFFWRTGSNASWLRLEGQAGTGHVDWREMLLGLGQVNVDVSESLRVSLEKKIEREEWLDSGLCQMKWCSQCHFMGKYAPRYTAAKWAKLRTYLDFRLPLQNTSLAKAGACDVALVVIVSAHEAVGALFQGCMDGKQDQQSLKLFRGYLPGAFLWALSMSAAFQKVGAYLVELDKADMEKLQPFCVCRLP